MKIAIRKNIFTWVLILNLIFLQFFFIRISRQGIKSGEDFIQTEWGILKWIVPLTGWKSDFIFLNRKKRYLRIMKLRKPRLIKL
jgi:hypothetical protein